MHTDEAEMAGKTWEVLSTGPVSSANNNEMAFRLGYYALRPPDLKHPPETARPFCDKMLKYVESIRSCMDPQILSRILNSHPRSYPTERPHSAEMKSASIICGRRLKISQLCWVVKQCNCCGCVKPYNADPWFVASPNKFNHARALVAEILHKKLGQVIPEKDIYDPIKHSAIQRKALSCPYVRTYFCSCLEHCKGGQWYSSGYQLTLYARSHGLAHAPDLSAASPNIHYICRDCDLDVPKLDGKVMMELPRTFSRRNNYGPILRPISVDGSISSEMALQKRLHAIVASMTYAEEAAVRSVVTMIRLVRLRHGSLKTTGVTTCLHSEGVLHRVLPLLPDQCQTISVRKSSDQSDPSDPSLGLQIYKCRWAIIKAYLEIIMHVQQHFPDGPYDFEYSKANLNAWDKEGILVGVEVFLPDGSSDDNTSRNNTDDTGTSFVRDGSDEGPAPLELTQELEHTFEGTDNVTSGDADPMEEANDALSRMNAVAQYLNGRATSCEIQVPQNSLHPLGEYANMDRLPYAWTKAFPKVFVPVVLDNDPEHPRWTLYGDRNSPLADQRNKPNYRNWAMYLMFRNDGLAAQHPVFCFALHGMKQKKLHFSQAKTFVYRANASIDPTTELKDMLQSFRDPQRLSELTKSLRSYQSNVPGSSAYWDVKYKEFLWSNFYQYYVKRQPLRCFFMLSSNEAHDPALRQLLAKYVGVVEEDNVILNNSEGTPTFVTGNMVLEEDKYYNQKIHDYSHIITLFFAAKFEMYLSLFLRQVFGIEDCAGATEFGKTRGHIHTHNNGYGSSKALVILMNPLTRLRIRLLLSRRSLMNILETILTNFAMVVRLMTHAKKLT
jgi:hypothetical protein